MKFHTVIPADLLEPTKFGLTGSIILQAEGASGGTVDPVVNGSKLFMEGEGWACFWDDPGQSYNIVRSSGDSYRIDRDFIEGCDYSSLPSPMAHDLADYSTQEEICPT